MGQGSLTALALACGSGFGPTLTGRRPFHPIAKSHSERQTQRLAGFLNAAASK